MRWAWLVLIGCSSTPAREPTIEPRPSSKPAAAVASPRDANAAAADPDPDHDRIAGVCDLCPDHPETYNGIVAKQLRLHLPKLAPGARIDEHVTAAWDLYVDEDGARDVPAAVDVQVMRAEGVEIWRWEDDHLVRATPRRRLPVPKLPAGC